MRPLGLWAKPEQVGQVGDGDFKLECIRIDYIFLKICFYFKIV